MLTRALSADRRRISNLKFISDLLTTKDITSLHHRDCAQAPQNSFQHSLLSRRLHEHPDHRRNVMPVVHSLRGGGGECNISALVLYGWGARRMVSARVDGLVNRPSCGSPVDLVESVCWSRTIGAQWKPK